MDEKHESWLLIDEDRVVPLVELHPDLLMEAARGAAFRPGTPIERRAVHADDVVRALGFDGGLLAWRSQHWPALLQAIAHNRGRTRADLFALPSYSMFFHRLRNERRALADRIFLDSRPLPTRVFLGWGYDWDAWEILYNKHYLNFNLYRWIQRPALNDENIEALRRWTYIYRTKLGPFMNFLGDQWLDGPSPIQYVQQLYFPHTMSAAERERDERHSVQVAETMRWFLERAPSGWVRIVKLSRSLVGLFGNDGSYDLLWKGCRDQAPPSAATGTHRGKLHVADRPSWLRSEGDFEPWYYFRADRWDERDRHESEWHYYNGGGLAGSEYPRYASILERYLQDCGVYPRPRVSGPLRRAPDHWHRLRNASGRPQVVSPLITIAEMRRMLPESGYGVRRSGALWDRGNDQDPESMPTTATWFDAAAFCAWMEKQLGAPVRLPTVKEYREWRPLPEPDPAPAVEFVDGELYFKGQPPLPISTEWLEEWGGVEGVPERCRFRPDVLWNEGPGGMRFIDSWDFFEWTDNCCAVGGYLDTDFPLDCWGAYKHCRTGFRIVIEEMDE